MKTDTGTIKYRNWLLKDNILYYNNIPALIYYKGGYIINSSFKFLYIKLKKLNKNIIWFGSNIENAIQEIDNQIKDFILCARNNYTISESALKLINKLDIDFQDKYLNYCKSLNHSEFFKVAQQHRSRKSNKTEVLEGLWYVEQYQPRV